MKTLADNELSRIRNERIGFVFQSFNLIPTLSVVENVALPLTYRGIPTAKRLERSLSALEAVGLSGRLSHKPYELSGGQQQRLCIARALLKNPKILILDDSTSAVDTATDASIRKAFSENIPDTTKLIISQRVSSVSHADKIIVMDDGEISAVGTHEELIKNSPIYNEIYVAQTSGNGDFDAKGEL